MRLSIFGLIVLTLSVAVSAVGEVVYYEDFEDYGPDPALSVLNWTGGTDWQVTDGTVDLVLSGQYKWLDGAKGEDQLDGGQYFVDLDGSTGIAGIFTSRTLAAKLEDGAYYNLSFIMAGNWRILPSDVVHIGFGVGQQLFDLRVYKTDPWKVFSVDFTYRAGTELYFENLGDDFCGALLDNVQIRTAQRPAPDGVVPEPATLLGVGLGVAGLALRRTRRPFS